MLANKSGPSERDFDMTLKQSSSGQQAEGENVGAVGAVGQANSNQREVQYTVWKCPKCTIYNRLEDGTKCQNFKDKICNFDIENGDQDADILEVAESEFQNHNH